MPTVLGIDPSTKTGLVALDDLNVIEAMEVICKPKFQHNLDRALHLSDQIVRVIERTSPTLVVFEGYGYSNQHTLVPLVEIGTAFRMSARMLGIDYIEVPPTTLKKAVTGSGNASKDVIMLEVFKRWGFEAKTNNIADAFGLAMIGQEILGTDTGMPKTHKDGLSKLKTLKQLKGV